jgi:hypothetical protein
MKISLRKSFLCALKNMAFMAQAIVMLALCTNFVLSKRAMEVTPQ